MIHYNLHGFLEIRLGSNNRHYRRYFDNEYLRIHKLSSGEGRPPIAVTVQIVSRLPEPRDGDVHQAVHFKRLLRFEYVVRGIETDDVHIFLRSHPIDAIYVTAVGVFLQAHILEPLVYWKLLQRDVMLLHAAGVKDSSGAYVFPASGGTGKTTLSLALMQMGYEFLGDDLLLVDGRSGLVYPYPRPLHLFTYNVSSLVGARRLFHVHAAVRLKDILRRVLQPVSRSELLISTRVHADRLYPDVRLGDPAPVRRITFLVKDDEMDAADFGDLESAALLILEAADLNKNLYSLLDSPALVAAIQREEVRVMTLLLSHVQEIGVFNSRTQPIGDLMAALRP